MPFIILSIIIQVTLVVHIMKTGRPTFWVWLVIMLPLVGSLAYFFAELLPELLNTRAGWQAKKVIQNKLNPDKDIKAAARQYHISDSVENSLKLADELYQKQSYEEACELYQRCLKGLYEHDPEIMFRLAKTEFALSHFSTTKQVLDDLIKHNPDFKNADAHLLYARTLEALKDIAAAEHEYETLHQYYVGPEADYYYAIMNKNQGNMIKAKELLDGILQKAELHGSHYKSLHKEWLKSAKQLLKELESGQSY